MCNILRCLHLISHYIVLNNKLYCYQTYKKILVVRIDLTVFILYFSGGCFQLSDAALQIYGPIKSIGFYWTLFHVTTNATAMHITDHLGWLLAKLILHLPIVSMPTRMLLTVVNNLESRLFHLKK